MLGRALERNSESELERVCEGVLGEPPEDVSEEPRELACEVAMRDEPEGALEGATEGALVKRCATLRSSTQRKRSAVKFHSAGAAPFCRSPRAISIETNCPAGLDTIRACAATNRPNRCRR